MLATPSPTLCQPDRSSTYSIHQLRLPHFISWYCFFGDAETQLSGGSRARFDDNRAINEEEELYSKAALDDIKEPALRLSLELFMIGKLSSFCASYMTATNAADS